MPSKKDLRDKVKEKGISGFEPEQDCSIDFRRYLVAAKKQEVINVKLEYLNNSENIRKVDINSEAFSSLKRSIKRDGVLQNIVVEVRPDEPERNLFVRAGGHRFLAKKTLLEESISSEKEKLGREISELDLERMYSKRPDLFEIPALIRIYKNPTDAISDSIRENEERNNLHFIDYADALALMLKTDANLTRELLATKENKNKKTIERFLKIAEMPLEVKNKFREHDKVFTRSFVWNSYATRKISHEDLIKDVNNRLSKNTPTNTAPTPKEKRKQKLQEYYNSVSLSEKVTIEIDKAFQHMNLI